MMGTNFGKLPYINIGIHTETICFKMPGTYLGSICSEGFVTTVNCGNKPTAPFDLFVRYLHKVLFMKLKI